MFFSGKYHTVRFQWIENFAPLHRVLRLKLLLIYWNIPFKQNIRLKLVEVDRDACLSLSTEINRNLYHWNKSSAFSFHHYCLLYLCAVWFLTYSQNKEEIYFIWAEKNNAMEMIVFTYIFFFYITLSGCACVRNV